MIWLVDIGNMRIKWARLGPRGLPTRMRAALHAGWGQAQFIRALAALREADEVIAVSVASKKIQLAFAAAVFSRTGRAPRFVASERRRGALRNGYREPWRLGADRWVAMCGARALLPRAKALLVVDVGTAATIDLVTQDGRHHGGFILPGTELMIGALLRGTGGIASRAATRVRRMGGGFGRDTAAALERGAEVALVASVLRARAIGKELCGSLPEIVLTGGAAQRLLRSMPAKTRHVSDLVLRGLAEYAQDHTSR